MKITKILVLPLVLLLAAVVGCDENNNMMSLQDPGDGDPPAESMCEGVNVDDCPCDYDIISKTAECWELGGNDEAMATYTAAGSSCVLALESEGGEGTPRMTADSGLCIINVVVLDAPLCTEAGLEIVHDDLTQDETTACQCRLEQYTKDLVQAGIEVSDDTGSGLTSEDISCPAE